MTDNTYNQVPYESYPYPSTHPAASWVIGKLFGMTPPDHKKCRVLELGCASGGNLLPMAMNMPESEFVGIDYSEKQIETGKKQVEELNLDNLDLRALSIMDMDEKEFGKFDYIITHGVYSWVPDDVREKIMQISKGMLAPNGIAYISYNTLPGWNMVKSVREMMLYHTQRFDDPATKITQAKALLKFILDGQKNDSPYKEVIKSELDILSLNNDSYTFHEHLEEENKPFYFHEVMDHATKNGLQYLGETNIATMFAGNMPKAVAGTLMATDDLGRMEQYMDFINNRRFRMTLFCHDDVVLNRKLKPEILEEFYIIGPFTRAEEKIADGKTEFVSTDGTTFSTDNDISVAIMDFWSAHRSKPLKPQSMYEAVATQTGKSVEDIRKAFAQMSLQLALAGGYKMFAEDGDYIAEVTDKPVVAPLARYQARLFPWVTTQRHEKLNIGVFERVMLQYMDGSHTLDEVVEKMLDHVGKNELTVQKEGKALEGKALEEEVSHIAKTSTAQLAPHALLIS